VTLLEPTASADVVKVAFPLLSCAVPSTVFPTANVTGPAGVTVGELIVAVNVTACPNVDGLDEDVNEADVVACVITWFTIEDVLP
jgi:hypothetical protein